MDIPLRCPNCGDRYRVEPRHVPRFGARVRCRECRELFDLPPVEFADGVDDDPLTLGNGRMNGLDPSHVARMTVLDILYSDEETVARARRDGVVLSSLRRQIDEAYATYEARVGATVAATTPHFRRAVISILLKGEASD